MSVARKFGRKYLAITCILWTIIVAVSLFWNINLAKVESLRIARITALTSYQKDLAFHVWSSQQGGVYIPAKDEVLPGPYPKNLPERNILTATGRMLTLVVPAELSRKVQTLAQERFHLYAHLTSLKPMREENAPDQWEKEALQAFEKGAKEVSSMDEKDGRNYYRLMRPFLINETCLECHTEQGYEIGDVGGGLSVAISMDPLLAATKKKRLATSIGHGVIWFFGLVVLVFGGIQLQSKVMSLQESKNFIQTIIDSIHDPTMVIDAKNYDIVLANKSARDQAGGLDSVKENMTCHQLSHHRDSPCDQAGEVCPLKQLMITKAPVKVTHTHFDAKNNRSTFSIVAAPIFNNDGEVVQIVESCRDISQELLLEAQLRQAQKMEAIGLLAGGVAHDFNNLLTGILGSTQLLKLDAEPGSEILKAVEIIEKAGYRAARLTEQLLGFARRGKFRNVAVDLHSAIPEVVEILSHTLNKSIVIEQNLDAKNARVMGDPNQIEQVLMNLAINARDSMPEGGTLTFETAEVCLDAEYVNNHNGAREGKHVLLSIEDTGLGIKKELIDRIFEPFFTTKSNEKGTGMGLAMVYGIVKNHQGSIRVYSEEGRGTIFKIYLPLAEEEIKEVAKFGPVPTDPPVGNEGILLVDDEEMIRVVAAKMLQNLGYQVASAVDGLEAIEYFKEHHSEISLVILDLIMPRMGGRDCFKKLREINPEIKVLLSTGYGLNGMLKELQDDGIHHVIQKPYRINSLAVKVREMLDS